MMILKIRGTHQLLIDKLGISFSNQIIYVIYNKGKEERNKIVQTLIHVSEVEQ
jgi:hypothetical protein